jgi:hypothetical protein
VVDHSRPQALFIGGGSWLYLGSSYKFLPRVSAGPTQAGPGTIVVNLD